MEVSPENDVKTAPLRRQKMPNKKVKYTDFIGILNKAALTSRQSLDLRHVITQYID
jgi:hypothetical protein